MALKITSIRLDPKVTKQLARIGKPSSTAPQTLIRQAIQEFIERHSK